MRKWPLLLVFAAATAVAGTPATPFDATADSVPKGFRGLDCAAIVKAIKHQAPAKDEFESTDAYKARIAAVSSATLAPGLTLGDVLAIRVDPRAVSMEFDADQQEATFSIDRSNLVLAFSADKQQLVPMVIASQRVVQRRSYVGGNAFGARTTVSASTSTGCGVAMANEATNRMDYFTRAYAKLDPETARAEKGHVAAILVGKPAAPFYGSFTRYSGATIDFPLESSIDGDAIFLDLTILYYDQRTGRVLARTSK
jgi:hypothetical protein